MQLSKPLIQPGTWAALAVLCLVLPACSTTRTGTPIGQIPLPPSRTAPQVSEPKPDPKPTQAESQPRAYSGVPADLKLPAVKAWRADVLTRIEKSSPSLFAEVIPLEPYKATVTLQITVLPSAQVLLDVLKSAKGNGKGPDAKMEQRAKETVRAAEPFPRPPVESPVVFSETWLFDGEGKFRIKGRAP